MIPLTEAREIIARIVKPLAPAETPLARVRGRVLRERVVALEDFPAFDRSAMDGYAIAAEDPAERFAVVGEVQPGQAPEFSIGPGECARIFTGAAIPAGASQVIMQEDVRREENWMIPLKRGAETHIRQRGEDAARGTVLLEPGIRLGPGETALLAQAGVVSPCVSPLPRVIHLATGSELVAPSEPPGPGQIRDSNSSLIAALLAESSAVLAAQQRCGDDLGALVARIRNEAVDSWDLLLISGGASVGDYDFGQRALAELEFAVHFQGVNLRPGKPLVFATRGHQAAFIIPGNPVSHFAVFHLAISAALEAMQAITPSWPLIDVVLDGTLSDRPSPRETYWPAHVSVDDGRLTARPLNWQSSGDLCGLVGANALLQIPPKTSAVSNGEMVKCLLLKVP